MNIFTKALKAIGLGSPVSKVRFPGRALVFFGFNDSASVQDMTDEVGDGTSADVLMTPIRWLQRAIVEAPVVAKDQKGEPIDPSDLLTLLARPNPFYSWEVLLAGTVLSLSMDGNAYWIAALNASGVPAELWYAPHTNVEPKWPSDDNSKFVTYYEYNVAGQMQKIRPAGAKDEDVDSEVADALVMIHFREGIDLDNLRKGLSPLKGLLREVWTDNEAAKFTAALLKNHGIPGVMVSPANSEDKLTPDEAKVVKAKLREEYTGSNRGVPLVMLGPTNVEQFGFSPKEMDLSVLRDVSEERVTAALHVPAAVVGFGSGLQQTKVGATMESLIRLAWTAGVIPLERIIAGEITRTLGPHFDAAKAEFDNLGVEALRENQDTKAKRIEGLVRAGIITRADARTALGFESLPSDDVYLMSMATIEVPRGVARPMPDGNGDGNPKGLDWADLTTGQRIHALTADYRRKQHSHGLAEERIIAAAPSRKPTRAAVAMLRRLDMARRRAGGVMQPGLEDVFNDLGAEMFRAAQDVLARTELGDVELVSDSGGETKQDLTSEGIAMAEAMLDSINWPAQQRALQEAIENGYGFVAQDVLGGIQESLGIEFVIDDAVQQSVLREGGLRAGLMDLEAQTRDALFEALAEGRAEGLAGDNLARHIRGGVEAGPWRDAATRARVIARTEGAHAANTSTLAAARAMPETEHVQVFDNRAGFDDDECMAADQSIVTIEEAEAMGLAHPNCTRGFVPINSLLMEEMGL